MIDHLFKLEYSRTFHCVHFVIRAAKDIFNLDYEQSFLGLTGSLDNALKTSRSTVVKNKRIDKPIEGCIVLMTYQNESSHCGLFYGNRIFHLAESGVQRITLKQANLLFKRIRFYEPNLHH